MERYKIFCTEEQTRKAIELGAPIKTSRNRFDEDVSPICQEGEGWLYAVIPTAEQMLGWLEEHEGISEVDIFKDFTWTFSIYNDELLIMDNYYAYNSRKEATLAAIDAALKHLKSKN